MAYETLLVESSEHVATITLNRPDKRNSINTQMIADFADCTRRGRENPRPRCNPHGAGKAFCAGMDLALLQAIATQSPSEKSGRFAPHGQNVRRILSFPKPMIAAVNGHALAGGCGIATHLRFHHRRPGSKVRLHQVKIGFLPAIVSVFLTRQIGEKRARDLLLTAGWWTAPKPKNRPRQRNRSPR